VRDTFQMFKSRLPSYHRRQVYDEDNPKFHIWTAHDLGNIAYLSQSTQNKKILSPYCNEFDFRKTPYESRNNVI